MPAKNRAFYLFSNRYAVHGTIIIIVSLVGAINFQSTEVRAETFGQRSLLYALVRTDDSNIVEVVTADDAFVDRQAISYMDDPSIDPNAHIDLNFIDEDYVTPTVGDSVASTTISPDEAEIVADRDSVITYVVQSGDTLGGISEKHGLSLSTVLWANNLTFRSVLKPGQELTIPPVDGVMHTVSSGQTLSSIAQNYGADADRIVSFNKLASANAIRIGQQLMIPGGEPPAPVAPRRTAPVTEIFTPTPKPAVANKPVTTSGWVWPTDWRVITQYYGWKHTGVDIDGDYSTHSYAAADGTVVFTGWKNGYGLTVEIDHGGGLKTRYAHHSKIYVEVGQRVSAGEAIAQTGTTGRSTGTHLHFEVIKNGAFQNPLDYVR